MKYRLIQAVEGRMVATEVNGDNIYATMDIRGYEFAGLNNNHRQRIELQGQPIFKGVAGPMWDGDAVRYECAEAFARIGA